MRYLHVLGRNMFVWAIAGGLSVTTALAAPRSDVGVRGHKAVTHPGQPEAADVPFNPGPESFNRPLLGALPCEVDADCDDSVDCTINRCVDSICTFEPDDSACPDDGLFCNGDEVCVPAAGCRSTGDPCVEPLPICREETDTCETAVTEIVLANGPVCLGGSESVEACIKLPPGAVFDKVDVFLLFDDTSSFEDEIPMVVDLFGGIVTDLETALPGVDLAFGIGRFEDYGGPGNTFDGDTNLSRPFILNQAIIQTSRADFSTLIGNALNATAPGFGGDGPESSAGEALYQVAMGDGFDGNGNASILDSGPAGAAATQTAPGPSGDVPGWDSYVGVGDGSLGGVGWREGSLRLVILATDVCSVAPFDFAEGIPMEIMGNCSTEPASAFACYTVEPGIARFGYVADAKSATNNTILDAVATGCGDDSNGRVGAEREGHSCHRVGTERAADRRSGAES